MTYRIRRHVDVESDILNLATWIARDSRDTAFRFLDAVEISILSLRKMPGRGSPKRSRDQRLAGIRSWSVNGFPNHLILYQFRGRDVHVLAVIHGARDYQTVLRRRV